jgi:hypothetical protein
MGSSAEQAHVETRLRGEVAARFGPLCTARIAEAEQHARELLRKQEAAITGLLCKEPLDAGVMTQQLSDVLVTYDNQV